MEATLFTLAVKYLENKVLFFFHFSIMCYFKVSELMWLNVSKFKEYQYNCKTRWWDSYANRWGT